MINGSTGGGGQATRAAEPGGAAPHGGGPGGAAAPAGGNGGAGQPFGGGGAGGSGNAANQGGSGGSGAYAMNIASTSVTASSTFVVGFGGQAVGTAPLGGAGGAGGIVITIYSTSSPNATGNDYAELFPVSNPIIGAGDIVAVDVGTPVSMKLAADGDTSPLAGIISTEPGQLLGNKDDLGMRAVALSGRVPTKVNLENGPIKIGDRIAISSVPGVGKKASPFDDSVGIALDNFDPSDSSGQDGKVMVFVNLQRGVDVSAIAMRLLGDDTKLFLDPETQASNVATNPATTSASTSTGVTLAGPLDSTLGKPLDFIGGMFNAFSKRISLLPDFANSSSTATTTQATSTASIDGYANGFFKSLVARLTKWFASAANGIGEFVANSVRAKEQICVDDQCLSKEDVRALINVARHGQRAGAADMTPSTNTRQPNAPRHYS